MSRTWTGSLLRYYRYFPLPPRVTKKIGKWTKPLVTVMNDYQVVLKETLDYIRTRPIRAVGILISFAGCCALWHKNPSLAHYTDSVCSYCIELSMCSESIRNPGAHLYISRIMSLQSNLQLRYYSLGFLSLIMKQNYEPCRNFTVTSKYLQPRWWDLSEKIVDIGIWNTWLRLEENMVDFDVNHSSLEDLS